MTPPVGSSRSDPRTRWPRQDFHGDGSSEESIFASQNAALRSTQSSILPAMPLSIFSPLLLLSFTSSVIAQSCISLAGSTACPAFNASSFSTNSNLTDHFPFLSNVTDTASFDSSLTQYMGGAYVQSKYQNLFACSNVDLSNTTDLYARYSMSFICNAIVQISIEPCALSVAESRPLCSDACSEFALSEESIVADPNLCGSTSSDPLRQLRADFTDCYLPANSSTGDVCIHGYENEPDNCGFQSNLEGLCGYCGGSTINSTDSCCVTSDVESRCQNVTLPAVFTLVQSFLPSSTSSGLTSQTSSSFTSPSSSSSSNNTSKGLSGGAIAGIVIGSILGALLLISLVVCFCIFLRRRKTNAEKSSLNQPTPPHTGSVMAQTAQPRFEPIPGARVTRMTALEGTSELSSNDRTPNSRLQYDPSSSDGFDTSPESRPPMPIIGGIGTPIPKRGTAADKSSPESYDDDSPEYSSPEGGVGQSEQLDSFKDYYSDDLINTEDLVSVLWAYQPRANDEFELERGDMLRIVGIWDDGWATGVRVHQRAEEWEHNRVPQRDSGVSGASRQEQTPPSTGEIKAFPLVCVCLPQHWSKTIEGDPTDPSSDEQPPSSD